MPQLITLKIDRDDKQLDALAVRCVLVWSPHQPLTTSPARTYEPTCLYTHLAAKCDVCAELRRRLVTSAGARRSPLLINVLTATGPARCPRRRRSTRPIRAWRRRRTSWRPGQLNNAVLAAEHLGNIRNKNSTRFDNTCSAVLCTLQ